MIHWFDYAFGSSRAMQGFYASGLIFAMYMFLKPDDRPGLFWQAGLLILACFGWYMFWHTKEKMNGTCKEPEKK